MVDQAAPNARKVTALELEALLVGLRDGAPEPQVVFFASKDSDVEGSSGLLGSRSKVGDAFLSLAERLRDSFSFAWTSDPAAAQQHGVKPGTVAVLHSRLLTGKLEPAAVAHTGSSADVDALEAWLWPASLPLVGPLTQRSAPRYLKAGGLLVRVAVPNSWADDAKGANYLLNRLRRVAGQHPGLRLVSMALDSPLAGLTEFGIGSGAAGALSVTAQTPEGAKYAMPGTWSPQAPEALQAWLKDLAAGKVETYVKSQPVPEGKEGGVTVVVGRTFDSVVLDDTKDVLVEFYAPWSVPSRGCSAPMMLCHLALTRRFPSGVLFPPPGAATARPWPPSTSSWPPRWRGCPRSPSPSWTPPPTTGPAATSTRSRASPPSTSSPPVRRPWPTTASGRRAPWPSGWLPAQPTSSRSPPPWAAPAAPPPRSPRRRRPTRMLGSCEGAAPVSRVTINRLASLHLVGASPSPCALRTPARKACMRPGHARDGGSDGLFCCVCEKFVRHGDWIFFTCRFAPCHPFPLPSAPRLREHGVHAAEDVLVACQWHTVARLARECLPRHLWQRCPVRLPPTGAR
jgi:hypothetical protein